MPSVTISIFTLFAAALALAAIAALGADRTVARRLRRPRLVQGTAVSAALALVPANLWCALVASEPGGHAHGTVGVCIALASLTALGAVAVLAMTLRLNATPARLPRRVLAIGAHPDDLELGCGGTLAKLADSGHEVHALVMSGGERGGDGSARPGEALRAGGFLGVTDLHVCGFTDTGLAGHGNGLIQCIERHLHRQNPDIILTHSGNDQHQDHRAVHLATMRAARRHSTILCYESPSAMASFQPSVFIDIEGYVGVKASAVAEHRDQRGKPYMRPESVHGMAVFRGSQAKARHAEAYEPVRLLSSSVGDL